MMGCCESKKGSKSLLKGLERGTVLYEASLMTTTLSGHSINNKVVKKVMTKAGQDQIARNPNTPEDFRLIFTHPFNAVNKITEYLYLTGIGGLYKENFDKLGITLIINATHEFPNTIVDGIFCIRVPVDDGNDDIGVYFDEVSDKIEQVAQKGGSTIVHCMAGASRSTTLVLAYLIKHEGISLHNAFNSVKKRRETARPNPNFFQQLIIYEIKTRGKASVKMIQLVREGVTVTVPDLYEKEHPGLFSWEVNKQINAKKGAQKGLKSKSKLIDDNFN